MDYVDFAAELMKKMVSVPSVISLRISREHRYGSEAAPDRGQKL